MILPALTQHYLLELASALGSPYSTMPQDFLLATLIKHGGYSMFHSPSKMQKRLMRYSVGLGEAEANEIALTFQDRAAMFFQRLSDRHYAIPAELVSHITFPHEGTTYTRERELENPNVPAVFTFIGQFIDHDLTFNGLDLFDDQLKTDAPNFASPKVDLDSVYGRVYPAGFYKSGTVPATNKDIFAPDGSFHLDRIDKNKYDLPRFTNPSSPFRLDGAYIGDPRNDENQIILQVHILLMRLHNRLLSTGKGSRDERIAQTRERVVEIWHSVLLNDFLPRVCRKDVLTERRAAIVQAVASGNYGALHYKPYAGNLQMPHEFAIGFRFGHSMLRSAYKINAGDPVNLFINRDIASKGDLRGGRKLSSTGNFIDWNVFYPKDGSPIPASLLIDSHVTPSVFDLPEATIPDEDKTEGNLPFRNLTRSRIINLASGEDLAATFGLTDIDVLSPEEIEPLQAAWQFYMHDRNVYPARNGVGEPVSSEPYHGVRDSRFKTPLWYYLLREAEAREKGITLGKLGSLLVSEVILGGIYFGTSYAYKDSPDAAILGSKKKSEITLRDLIDFVLE